jgi:PTS system galactitol-specific IIA component
VFAASLCLPRVDVATAEQAVRALAGRLFAEGKVLASFEAAAVLREKRSPTGLPFRGGAVALPHAEPEHVVVPAVAVATLAHPVRFRQMGAPAVQLEVSLVVMPALSAKEQAAAGLARLLELLQDDALHASLRAADSADAMCAALSRAARGWSP